MLVDRTLLRNAQESDDIVRAEEVLQSAYQTDVRPLLAQVRLELGIGADPLAAYRASGYQAKANEARTVNRATLDSGYPG